MKNQERIANLLTMDPMTGDQLEVASDLITDGVDRYSFIVRNPKNGVKYQHILKMSETDGDVPVFDDIYSENLKLKEILKLIADSKGQPCNAEILQVLAECAISDLDMTGVKTVDVAKYLKNEIKHSFCLNGQIIDWDLEEQNSLCVCGHTKLAHIHFNGGLNIPEGQATYCGYPQQIGDEVRYCECSLFNEAKQ
jgi:hypothetical protein